MERNVPKLRFKGFSDEWKKAKFKELLNVIDGDRGVNYPKEDEFTEEGYCLFLNAKNVTKEGFKFNENKFISSEKDSILRKGKLERNDIVLTTRGTVGNRAIFTTDIKYDNIRINSGMVLLRANKIEPHYLYSYMKSIQFDKQLKQIMFGSAQPQLTVKDINEFKVSLPSIQEQERIANFLTKVDKIIEKQDEKVKNLEKYKKGMMQKIFSQEIRFKDENGNEYPEWKELKISDTLKIKHGKDQKKVECENGKYPILGTGGEIGRTNIPIYNKESVLIGRKGTIDRPVYMDTPFWTVDTLFYSQVFNNYNAKFIYYNFQCINWKKYCEASGVPSLSAATIENIKYMIPVLQEQIKIANFLSCIDDVLDKEKEKLQEIREWKKGLLQQMFV